MRVLFAGTPAVAVPAFEAILDSGHDVRGVLTRPPAPVGRKRVLTPSPIHAAAEIADKRVLTGGPTSEEVMSFLREEHIDCVAVVAYGALIKEPALSIPTYGWVNLHFSLLPAWRGAAPVQYAIMGGDGETGACTFQIEAGLDTGPVFNQIFEPISNTDTAGDLLERLAYKGAPLLVRTLDEIEAGTATALPQVGQATHAPTLSSVHARIDWSAPAEQLSAHIRAMTPAPGAWTSAEDQRFKLGPVTPVTNTHDLAPGQIRVINSELLVGTGSNPVQLDRLAPPGKPWMNAGDWARGARPDNLRFEVSA